MAPILTAPVGPRLEATRLVKLAALAAIAAVLVYLLFVAIQLRIDYFDSFESLQDARFILAGDGSQYLTNRGLLFPALYVPFLWAEQVLGVSGLAFVAIHLLAVTIFGVLLYALYRLFRRYMAGHFAAIGVLLFALNVLLIHNGPLGKEDIPGAMLITVGFLSYVRGREEKRRKILIGAGVCIGLGISIRFNLVPLPFTVIAIYEVAGTLLNGRRRRAYTPIPRDLGLVEALTLFALPIFIFFLVPVTFYPVLGLDTPWHAPVKYIAFLQDLSAGLQIGTGDPLADVRFPKFLIESMTWPVLACAGFGGVWSIYKRRGGALFHFIWFVVFFGVQDYAVVFKEARYLIATFPPLYFFVARGAEGATEIVRRGVPRRQVRVALQGLLLGALLAIPGFIALKECEKWTDPTYTSDYENIVSSSAVTLAAGHRVFWAGSPYAIHPVDFVFDTDDPYTYIYHFFAHVAGFWSRSVVYWFPVGSLAPDRSDPVALRVGPNLASSVRDGDVLIVSPYLEQQTTATVPDRVAPLVVERVRMTTFLVRGDGVYGSADGGRIAIRPGASTVTLEGSSLPNRQYEAYAFPAGRGPTSLGDVTAQGGNMLLTVPSTSWAALQQVSEIDLLYYDSAAAFPQPATAH